MSAANITPAEEDALSYAREDFVRDPSAINAANLLMATWDVWNESHLSELDLAAEMIFVAARLKDVHRECQTVRETLAFGERP